ncbi:MAG: phosphomannomutase/phosphoglucomutase [Verrucomicrobia bacterium]|nr:phosphomannomutase/phosphoglucomutase [Verrucomicrobiota bacterium]MCG2681704.1 phosphomannomutase/phosphoglucomutase [Kiritimatiellia bacterium]MBU4248519.1 phosphomannomutase/phosphoglucomutase [Verrucomicrobiota bacterium]MBU4290192.1 phosphomannomutase/phosphoglucomutase [Verrucomicrobiota bacterium]MBU4428230.1 phosphomannomutase/phosphoglucomutase [Verrucomicrobiota bacterium]
MSGIFKAYDIRGIVGKDLTEDVAFRIGRAFATFLKCRKVVVGQDMRPHSEVMFQALSRGLLLQGADVIRLGLCSTPMSYYANGKLGADAGIMITASHNPAEWNGFKLCRELAIPISGDTGIKDIECLVQAGAFDPAPAKPGILTVYDILPEYVAHVASCAAIKRPMRIAVDFANAMGIMEAKALKGLLAIDPLYDTFDGTFPHHEANPLKTETLEALQAKVRSGNCNFGVAFDGDADRAGFVDEKGEIIPMDMITALIAQSILKKEKGDIFYDLRSSWTVREVILENGGTPHMCRVGHAFIKQQMRAVKAIFAGELSGHYYFRDNYYTESSSMAVLFLANLLSLSTQTLSELVRPLQRYAKSPEVNSEVKDPPAVLRRLKDRYHDGKLLELDGLSVEFPDWWFNVRASNTEPLVRLNLEAKTQAVLDQRQAELLKIIRAG